MTRLEQIEQIDFRLLGVTQSLKILTAFDNLLMFPQSARQMKTIKKKGGEKIQRCDSSKFLTCTNCEKWTNVCPSAISMSSSVAAVPSSTPWRDNLINWKSGDLFFYSYTLPPTHLIKIQPNPEGCLCSRPTAWLNDRFSPAQGSPSSSSPLYSH